MGFILYLVYGLNPILSRPFLFYEISYFHIRLQVCLHAEHLFGDAVCALDEREQDQHIENTFGYVIPTHTDG